MKWLRQRPGIFEKLQGQGCVSLLKYGDTPLLYFIWHAKHGVRGEPFLV